MKALLIGNFGHGWDGSICDEENVARSLETMGHQVIRWQREQFESYLSKADSYDFTLIFQWDGYPENFPKRLPHPIVYWAFDYQKQDQEWHNSLIDGADIYISKRYADVVYPNWHWGPDFAPDFLVQYPWHRDGRPIEKDIDVLFTGSWLPWAEERNQTLALLNEKFNLVVYSSFPDQWPPEFENVHRGIHDHELPSLIARAKVNLAVDHTIETGYWSDRAAQIIACGGFVLQRYVAPMESYFHAAVAYYYGLHDVESQVKWWLEHDEDREVFQRTAYQFSDLFKAEARVGDILTIIRSKMT